MNDERLYTAKEVEEIAWRSTRPWVDADRWKPGSPYAIDREAFYREHIRKTMAAFTR